MSETVKVWDVFVRVFHWSLAIFFVLAYLTGEGEVESLHAWAGYIIIGLLIFRIVWGLIGTRHARFSDFIYSPKTIGAYLISLISDSGKPKHYLGHNPAGGAMIILMLIFLSLSSWSGLKAYEAEGKGPLASAEMNLVSLAQADGWYEDEHDEHDEGHEEDEFWEEVHEAFINFTLLLIFLHLGGVFISSALHRENLVKAMVTGRKEKQ